MIPNQAHPEFSTLKLIQTKDGSPTFFHPGIGEHYHSHHGALQEAKHVFLKSGLQYFLDQHPLQKDYAVSILEMGFGTGLNFFITSNYCQENNLNLFYHSIEKFPLPAELFEKTGYSKLLTGEHAASFMQQYKRLNLTETFQPAIALEKIQLELFTGGAESFQTTHRFDVLYFDAFSAIHQPEMWERELLEPLCNYLKPGGVFVTYAITGNLKRLIRSLGFQIQKIPGAPGKREMLRAVRVP